MTNYDRFQNCDMDTMMEFLKRTNVSCPPSYMPHGNNCKMGAINCGECWINWFNSEVAE